MRIEELSQRLSMSGFDTEIMCAIANVPLHEDEEGKYIDDARLDEILILLPEEYSYYQNSVFPKKIVQMDKYRKKLMQSD